MAEYRGKTFIKKPCIYCGKLVSNAGFAHFNHLSKHAREGLLIQGEHLGQPMFTDTDKGVEARKEHATE